MTHPIDTHVGIEIRKNRLAKRMTQKQLGDSIGVKFQQVQKYEAASNRISASRLCEVAAALDLPISAFFPESFHDREFSGPERHLVENFRAATKSAQESLTTIATMAGGSAHV